MAESLEFNASKQRRVAAKRNGDYSRFEGEAGAARRTRSSAARSACVCRPPGRALEEEVAQAVAAGGPDAEGVRQQLQEQQIGVAP